MKNIMNETKAIFPKMVEDYKITESFIFNNELHITCEYDLSMENFLFMEESLLALF